MTINETALLYFLILSVIGMAGVIHLFAWLISGGETASLRYWVTVFLLILLFNVLTVNLFIRGLFPVLSCGG